METPTERAAGVLVVGGTILLEIDGQLYLQERFVSYLRALQPAYDDVVFAGRVSTAWRDASRLSKVPSGVRAIELGSADVNDGLSALARSIRTVSLIFPLARRRYDVIHFFPDLAGPWALLLLRLLNIRWLTYWKSDWIAYSRATAGGFAGRLRAWWWGATAWLDLRGAHAVVARSPTHLADLRRSRPDAQPASPLLATLGSPGKRRGLSTPPRLLFVGTQDPRKGLDELAAAVGHLQRDGVPLHVRVVGGVPDPDAGGARVAPFLERALAEHGVRDRFSFAGFVNDPVLLEREYLTADIFVLPSRFEGFPRVIDEAMSYGLPVIATRLDGIVDALEPHEAVLVPPREPEALAREILRMLTDNELRARLAEASRGSYIRRVRETAAAQHLRLLTSTMRR